MTKTSLLSLAFVSLLGLSGCAINGPLNYYQLQGAEAPETLSEDSQIAVLLGPVKVADYLQRETIMQREGNGSLSTSANARWAGNLQDDIGQLLLRQISGDLKTSRIALYPDRVGFKPQAQIVLSISRLDSGQEQPAVLEAQWRVLDANGDLRSSRVITLKQQHDGSLAGQIKAQSDLLRKLAGQITSAIELSNFVKVSSMQPNAELENEVVSTKENPNTQVEKYTLPGFEKGREGVEIFRF